MRTRDEGKLEAIMHHALKMIVKSGFDGLSMQKLARAAGVSPATIYIYFKDRDDLLLQLYLSELNKYFEYIMEDFDPNMDFATGLRRQWKRRADYVLKQPEKAHFMEHFSFTPLHIKAIKMRDPRVGEMMDSFVKNAIRNKQIVEISFEVYWSITFGPLYNLLRWDQASRNVAGHKFQLTQEMLDQTLELVIKALTP